MSRKAIDLTGQRFGRLVVAKRVENSKDGHAKWLCKCDCGNEILVPSSYLNRGHTKSCGCLHDLTGKRFYRLTIIGDSGERKRGSVLWECLCDCGNVVFLISSEMINGNTKSCGCLQKDNAKINITKYYEKFLFKGTALDKIANNKELRKDNKSGICGVSWDAAKSKWHVYINIKAKRYHLGYFSDINDAIAARKAAEEKYFKPVLDEHENQKKEAINE